MFYIESTQITYALYENKGSKFISYLFPIVLQNSNNMHFKNQKEQIRQSLKIEHKKATHFIEAFRILNENNQIIEGCTDDGEPKGSAGMPILEVLRSEEIINILCICIRYFGGTKLGVGGLARAYRQSIINAIEKCKKQNAIKEHKNLSIFELHNKTNQYNKIRYLISKYNFTIMHKNFNIDNITLKIKGEQDRIHEFLKELDS